MKTANATMAKLTKALKNRPMFDVQRDRARVTRGGKGLVRAGCRALAQHHLHVREVDVAHEDTEGRHHDVVHEALHHGAERTADDDADRHVHHVPADGEFPEFLHEAHAYLR